jgi:hypothetical protein
MFASFNFYIKNLVPKFMYSYNYSLFFLKLLEHDINLYASKFNLIPF